MRDSFTGYYPPDEPEYQRLWAEGLIVIDTNVLLSVYRLPMTAREEFLGLLEVLRERLWIPHQVGLEFQNRRVRVILQARDKAESVLRSSQESVARTKSQVLELELDKTGLELDPAKLLSDLDDANSRLAESIQRMHSSLVDVSSVDPIRDRLDSLLEGRVGRGPTDQAALDVLVDGAEYRYENEIPPGFKDESKDSDPNGSGFVFDQIRYERKYGDLILWRQLLAHVQEHDIKTVLFVTSDQKSDWWWQERGRTLGPHPELIREIGRVTSVELFWMYTAKSFADHAGRYTSATVSEKSVSEIASASTVPRNARSFLGSDSDSERRPGPRPSIGTNRAMSAEIEQVVVEWLLSQGFRVVSQDGPPFPDILISNGPGRPHGVEVKFVQRPDSMFHPRLIEDSFLRGYVEIEEGRISDLTLVFAIVLNGGERDLFGSEGPDVERVVDRLGTVIDRLQLRVRKRRLNVILGAVTDGGFDVIQHWGEPFRD